MSPVIYEGHADQKFGCVTYSQHGEDLMLLNLLKLLNYGEGSVTKTTWLDVGAHHPTNISNTKLLYENGFRGVNVEANPNLMAAFNEERPEDINVNTAVGVREGIGTFYMYDPQSGRNTFSTEEVSSQGDSMPKPVEVKLPLRQLQSIVTDHCNGKYPFILSLDIEGMDHAVLSTTIFTDSYPAIIVVETRRAHSGKMINTMQSKWYTPLCRMGENLIFLHNSYYGAAF